MTAAAAIFASVVLIISPCLTTREQHAFRQVCKALRQAVSHCALSESFGGGYWFHRHWKNFNHPGLGAWPSVRAMGFYNWSAWDAFRTTTWPLKLQELNLNLCYGLETKEQLEEIAVACPALQKLGITWSMGFRDLDWTIFCELKTLSVRKPEENNAFAAFDSLPPRLASFECFLPLVWFPRLPTTLTALNLLLTQRTVDQESPFPATLQKLQLRTEHRAKLKPPVSAWRLPALRCLTIVNNLWQDFAIWGVFFDFGSRPTNIQSLVFKECDLVPRLEAEDFPRLEELELPGLCTDTLRRFSQQLLSFKSGDFKFSATHNCNVKLHFELPALRTLSIHVCGCEDLSFIQLLPRLKNLELKCHKTPPDPDHVLRPKLRRLEISWTGAGKHFHHATYVKKKPSLSIMGAFIAGTSPDAFIQIPWVKSDD